MFAPDPYFSSLLRVSNNHAFGPTMIQASLQSKPDSHLSNQYFPINPYFSNGSEPRITLFEPYCWNSTSHNLPPTPSPQTIRNGGTCNSSENPRRIIGDSVGREIIELTSKNPTLFAWEIQRNLIENGFCSSRTVPKKTTIQKFLNQNKRCLEPKTNGNQQINVESCQTFVQNSSVIQCSSSMINESNSPECSICLDEFHDGEMLNVLFCSHEFHQNCLEIWFSKSRSCPMCRQSIDYRLEPVTFLT